MPKPRSGGVSHRYPYLVFVADRAGRHDPGHLPLRRGRRHGRAAGDRFGWLTDPFGHSWSSGTHVEDVPPEEMAERAKDAMSAMSSTG
jgi:hypothetical protein